MANVRFATELVFEPQQLADLLKHAEVAGSRRLGEAPPELWRAFRETPLELLPGGGRHRHRALDYLGAALPALAPHHLVYLHAGVDSTKAIYFSRRVPRTLSTRVHAARAGEVVALVRRTLLVARFLCDPRVAAIYRRGALNVRETWVAVGRAFARTPGVDARLRSAAIAWDVVYDTWEEGFLDQVARNMNACIARGIRRLGEISKPDQKTVLGWLDGKPVDLSHLRRQKQETSVSVMVEWKTQLRSVLIVGQVIEGEEKKATYETKRKKTESRKGSKKRSESKGKTASVSSSKKSTTIKLSTGAKATTEKKASTPKKSSIEASVSIGNKTSAGKKLTKEVKLTVRAMGSLGEIFAGKKASSENKASTAKKLEKRR
jgi:hypothetical protein